MRNYSPERKIDCSSRDLKSKDVALGSIKASTERYDTSHRSSLLSASKHL